MWLRKIWYLHQLRRTQWLKPTELQKVQEKKLRAMIKHAYHNTEFYHRRLKNVGVRPEDIKTTEDLLKIPITSREGMKRGFRSGRILRRGLDTSGCIHTRTTGTSGEPLTLIYDEMGDDFEKAVAVRSFLESGGRLRDKWAMITIPHRMHMKRQWFQLFGFLSPIYLSVFDSPEHNLSVFKTLKPDVIESYTSYLLLLARTMREKGIKNVRPRIIVTTAEILTPEGRKYINDTFGLELFDQFGCAEVGRSAWECDQYTGYHMDVDALVMEFVQDNEHVASGERGHLLYTSLFNYAMPIIRYDVGDICVPTDELCPCGRGLPLIKSIEGRMDDFVTATDGTIVSPTLLLIFMKETTGIAQFRITQETRSRFEVQLVKDVDFSKKTIVDVENGMRRVVGKDADVRIRLVEEIPKEKSGKLRAIISKVRVDW